MADIITEIFFNGITKGIDKKHSLTKELFSTFTNNESDSLNKLKIISEDLLFKDSENDILVKCKNESQITKVLKKFGYQVIKKENYPFSEYNYAGGENEINYINNFEEIFPETIKINNKEFKYFYENSFLILYNEENGKTEYFYNIYNLKVQDIKIDNQLFVYILYKYKNKQYLAKTHLAKEFLKYNEENSYFQLKELFFNILIQDDTDKFYKEILFVNGNKIYLFNNKIKELKLYKKYYFIDGEFIYFNHHGEMKQYKNYFLEEIQVEYNNLYNYLNFLGLNNFKIKNRKISTYEKEMFLNIFKNKFDNTFNGGTNYFIIKNHYDNVNDKEKNIFKLNPDFHINHTDNFFNITGNFTYKMEKGNYKINISKDTVTLLRKENDIYKILDRMTLSNNDTFYFYQLKFQLISFDFPKKYDFEISVTDEYPYKQQKIKKDFEKIYSSKNNVEYFLNKENNENFDITYVKNNSICFQNLFNWSNKNFLFNSIKRKLKAGEKFDLNKIEDFYIDSSYEIKNNFLFPRNNCTITYTNIKNYKFELINDKNYITDFWINNENKILYFKRNKNQIDIIENPNIADYKVYIPSIKNFLNNGKTIKNIDILMNDEFEYIIENKNNILATTKFQNIPLFYKVYIENFSIEEVNLFKDDGVYIDNYFVEEYKNGVVVYFNNNKNSKYYYTSVNSDEKYYFEPIKAYENILDYHIIEKDGNINFKELKKIELVSFNTKLSNLPTDFNVKIFIYNTKENNVKRINLEKESLNKIFELNSLTDKISIILPEHFEFEDFYLVESSNTSLIDNEKIIYFKENYDDICYLTHENENFNIKDFYNKIQLNKKYIFSNNKLIEDVNGDIYLNKILDNSIYIEKINEELKFEKTIFKTFSTSAPDKFYIDNFKGIDIEHEFIDIKDSIKIESFNKKINF